MTCSRSQLVNEWQSQKENSGPSGCRAWAPSTVNAACRGEHRGLWAMTLLGLSWGSQAMPRPHSWGGRKVGSGGKCFVHYKPHISGGKWAQSGTQGLGQRPAQGRREAWEPLPAAGLRLLTWGAGRCLPASRNDSTPSSADSGRVLALHAGEVPGPHLHTGCASSLEPALRGRGAGHESRLG